MRKKTRTHKCTETTTDLDNSELVVILVAVGCGERRDERRVIYIIRS